MTREQYEAKAAPWLTWLAFAFLAIYAVPILWPQMNAGLRSAFAVATLAIWIIFVADLVVRVVLDEHGVRFLIRHPIDVLFVALPMLRPLRVLRVFTAGEVLFSRGRGLLKTTQAIVFAAALLIFIGALAILDAERHAANATIRNFGDAIWWAMTTVSTVGYGDTYPVTATGRIVAIALMLIGISILGLVTATVTTWFVAQERTVAQRLDAIEAKLDQLLHEFERHNPGDSRSGQ